MDSLILDLPWSGTITISIYVSILKRLKLISYVLEKWVFGKNYRKNLIVITQNVSEISLFLLTMYRACRVILGGNLNLIRVHSSSKIGKVGRQCPKV